MIIDMKTRKSNVRPTFDIAPFAQTGESSQTDVVESSGGKMFLTKGTKKQTRYVFWVFFRSESGKIAAVDEKVTVLCSIVE